MARTSMPGFEEGTLNAYAIRGDEIIPGDRFGYKVVMVVDTAGRTFRAYRGATAWSDNRVLFEGDAVTYDIVRTLFPVVVASLEAQGCIYSP